MTREGALGYFKRRKKILGLSDDVQEAEDMAIKALEQEPILDKIRAEIESKKETVIGRYNSATPMYDMASYKIERNKVREECMEIIDKYRQEG